MRDMNSVTAVLGLLFLAILNQRVDARYYRQKRFVPLTRCYGVLGCLSTGGVFYDLIRRPLQVLPRDRDIINTNFILHTRKNPVSEQALKADEDSIKNSFFDREKDTKVIVHGFTENGRVSWVKTMMRELLKHGDYNVIIVDWGNGAYPPYTQATANTRLVGAEIAYLLQELYVAVNVKGNSFHIIGHSLGAHVAGYTGKRLANLGRISGLDPAEPYFENTHPDVRLDANDAEFVDVTHTDIGSVLNSLTFNGGLGMAQSCGDVDIFPNGGTDQPGCDNGIIESITLDGIYMGFKQFVACNHLKAYKYFTESINSHQCSFKAYPCATYDEFKNGKCMNCGGMGCTYMGFHANRTTSQTEVKYYLDTAPHFPFCRHSFAIQLDLGDQKERGHVYIMVQTKDGVTDEIKITQKKLKIEVDKSYGFSFMTDHTVGDITGLTIWWIHDPKWIWEWNLPFSPDPRIFINKLTLVNGDTQQRVEFCGNGYKLKTNERKTFFPEQSC